MRGDLDWPRLQKSSKKVKVEKLIDKLPIPVYPVYCGIP
jgi:hypothetical protein